jgi:hypothetical protein
MTEIEPVWKTRLRSLLEVRSFTVLRMMLDEEEAAPPDKRFFSDELLAQLQAAVQTSMLDPIYLIMHGALGDKAKVQELREWLKNKQPRWMQSMDPQRARELGLDTWPPTYQGDSDASYRR